MFIPMQQNNPLLPKTQKDVLNAKRMKKMLKNRFPIFTLMVGLLAGLAACGNEDEAPATEAAAPEAKTIEVMPLATSEVAFSSRYTANLEANEINHLGAATPGRIKEIYVDEGDRVEQGQLLVQMDESQLLQARVQMETARRELRRMDTLVAVGSVPRQQLEQAQSQFDIAQTTYQNLLENTQLRAPISGVVTDVYLNEGEVFSMSPTAAGVPAILTIKQLDPLNVVLNLSEALFPKIEEGQEVQVLVDIYPDQIFTGEIAHVYPTIDPNSRTFTVEVRVPNPEMKLRPGMFARVNLGVGQQQGLFVPASAVLKGTGTIQRYVFIVQGDTAVRRLVELGTRNDSLVQIRSGIAPEDVLVVTGQEKLEQGDLVKMVEQETL